MDAVEIVATDEKITGETAAIIERIARRFRQLERFTLPFRHLRSVDDRRGWFFRLAIGRIRPTGGLGAGFLSDLFFRRFERAFHLFLNW